jgi:hypothetical protein
MKDVLILVGIYTAMIGLGLLGVYAAEETGFIDKQPVGQSESVDPQFKAGFEAGVKYGILSYMQNPEQDGLDFHIKEAQKWYWLVVVDGGTTLVKRATSGGKER